MIDTHRKNGAMKLTNLRRMDELEQTIVEIPELSKPLSLVSIAKISNKHTIMVIQNTMSCQLHKKKYFYCLI